MIKWIFYILPFVSFAQTWNMEADHRLLQYTNYEIDSLIGNGRTLYFMCGSELKINKHVENVKFATWIFVGQKCRPWNKVIFTDSTYYNNVAYPKDCINIVGVNPNIGKTTTGGKGNGKGKNNNKNRQ